jgi:hypothetical protein
VLETDDGPVSVPPVRTAQLEPFANRVDIPIDEEFEVALLPPGEVDQPNSRRLAGKVLARDGLRCANPGCGRRRNLHAHHIEFRSKGGRTALANEIALCETCHSLVHTGRLEISGNPHSGLTWKPRPTSACAQLRDAEALLFELRDLDAEISGRALAGRSQAVGAQVGNGSIQQSAVADSNGAPPHALPEVSAHADLDGHSRPVALPESAHADSGGRRRPLAMSKSTYADSGGRRRPLALSESTYADSNGHGEPGAPPLRWQSAHADSLPHLTHLVDDLADGLARLGWSRKSGERHVRDAIAALLAGRATEPDGTPIPARTMSELDDAEVIQLVLSGQARCPRA